MSCVVTCLLPYFLPLHTPHFGPSYYLSTPTFCQAVTSSDFVSLLATIPACMDHRFAMDCQKITRNIGDFWKSLATALYHCPSNRSTTFDQKTMPADIDQTHPKALPPSKVTGLTPELHNRSHTSRQKFAAVRQFQCC